MKDKFDMVNTPTQPEVPTTPDEWVSTTPLYGNYTETRSAYDCSNWLPLSSTITTTSSFQQSSSTCKVDQSRTVQAQERNTAGDIRAVGSPITESNTLSNQPATRSYTVTLSEWSTDAGTCDNWSPQPSTLPASATNITEQTQTCNDNKSRTRNESYINNETSSVVTLPPTTETDRTPTTKSRDVSDSFSCEADTSGDEWNAYLVFKDGSGEYALLEDQSFNNPETGNYQFRTNVEYKDSPEDTAVYIFYKGAYVTTRSYYSQTVDVYQACTRVFEW